VFVAMIRTPYLTYPLLFVSFAAVADEPAWMPLRDQNPFVLGDGIPLQPKPLMPPVSLSVDAYVAEGNTQLISSSHATNVLFAAETREMRVTVDYALSDNWSARASLGDVWIGVGFLDSPIQHFHRLIGAPQGYRGGRLRVQPPDIRVTQDGNLLYRLNSSGQALAPLLLDLTRSWNLTQTTSYGVTLGAKLPTGNTSRLSDTGTTGVSVSGFFDTVWQNDIHAGARIGYLHESGNDVLPTLSRSSVSFADTYARMPFLGAWNVQLQYDAHTALYRNVPVFLRYAGLLSLGLTRPLGTRSELMLGVSEDVPMGHTQDVVLEVALRVLSGSR
jgi:hypothetical protein